MFQAERFRVIRANEVDFPAFYRVIWTEHVAEFTDLSLQDRNLCMACVAAVEHALRENLQPTKINLATLGNMVPHLHWHVIARFDWDSRFPAAVWAEPKRVADRVAEEVVRAKLPLAEQDMATRLAQFV